MKMMTKEKKKAWQAKLEKTLKDVHDASYVSALIPEAKRNKILLSISSSIKKRKAEIIRENQKDLEQARKNGLNSAMIDRLTLNEERIDQMTDGVKVVANLETPLGKNLYSSKRPNGLKIKRVSVPIGVILIIYESRPNVTVECAALCFKSGNAVLLRGGKEAFFSNQILAAIFSDVLLQNKISPACVSFLKTTDREAVDFLLQKDEMINLVIPRGGKSLIQKVVSCSKIPVIKHFNGVCHIYVDVKADLDKAVDIAFNAKMQRTGVCNAMEALLVHEKIAARFLPIIGKKLQASGCEIRGDAKTRQYIAWAKKAQKDDYGKEFLDKILLVCVVSNVQQAMDHIRLYGSGHTEAIITNHQMTADTFCQQVDASSVMVNASTRFADGFEYGFGAEIGISTDKIHARGPMGLEGLTSYKYIVEGNGQIRK
jgi:glutamate-5-semialdehyde dehydrogenase